MNKKIFLTILVLIIITFQFLGMSNRKYLHYEKLNNRKFNCLLKHHFSNKKFYIYKTELGRFAVVFADTIENYVLTTADYSEIEGYQGYSNLAIILDAEGKVERINFLNSDDSEPYVKLILNTDILSILSNQHLLTKERPIHIVTGATITSEVFSKSVSKTLDTFREIYVNIKWEDNKIQIPDSFKLLQYK